MSSDTKPNLFGYGLTTKAIAKSLDGGCIFYDDHCKESYRDEQGNTINPSSLFDPSTSLLEVTTPSLKPQNPLIQKAQNLMSEYDYILSHIEGERPLNIWISGTNGKTTTTQMLTHLLKSRGALSGGNIGTHTHTVSPDIYLLLPITPDHLDWHGGEIEYERDKLRPLESMREGELALVPKGLNLPKSDAWIVEYDGDRFLEEFFKLDGSKLRYRAAFLQDALLSLAITRVLFDEADYELLNSFEMDHHRQEELHDYRDILWVNDSKATNIDATMQALMNYKESKIHLIIGGDDKGVELDGLMDSIASLDVELYCIGSNTDRVSSLAKQREISSEACYELSTAMSSIAQRISQNEVALLSPAASSLDQFSSYAQRGNDFIKFVEDLSSD